ncbi:MAG TPA: sterol desaturase family protein [Flavobacteriales bacterium]|jgi:sterol desaturase/sphingolipid hydroxylase (fatty acid hydroxylase superfamily)|nr:sterol desaturase family protein [Flavobacteriales bacterium]
MGDITNFAIPFFLATLMIEVALSLYGNREYYTKKDTFASLIMGIGSIGSSLITKGLKFGVFTFLYEYRLIEIPMVWWGFIALLLADDFSYYWFHRTSHKMRYFWASHVVHHSSQHYNLSTALRQTWTGEISGSFIFYAWMPLVGFDPLWILTAQSTSLIYQYWIHTEVIRKMPRWFELIFNTPSHHRVHHGSDLQYLDMNYAGILIVWDKMFGTFIDETKAPTYGLITNISTYNPARIAFSEWGNLARDVYRTSGILNKLRYIFAPPGWSPDGSTLTTDEMREEAN